MALSKNVVDEVQATIACAGGIHHKMDKVLSILTTRGWAQKITLKPSEILCHPSNRGGAMVSYHDVCVKGVRRPFGPIEWPRAFIGCMIAKPFSFLAKAFFSPPLIPSFFHDP